MSNREQLYALARDYSFAQLPAPAEKERFQLTAEECGTLVQDRCGYNGIGLLAEKTMHATLKNFYEPNPAHQEVAVGNQVADIKVHNHIIEIQSNSLSGMHSKINRYLKSDFTLTIVYPLLLEKRIIWIEPDSGELSKPRKSPRSATLYDSVRELMRLRPFLADPRVSIDLCFVTALEYRFKDGWSRDGKKGSSRHEILPQELCFVVTLTKAEDYQIFIPEKLPVPFTTADFAQAARIPRKTAGTCLTMLFQLGQVKRVGKEKNAYLYELIN